MMENVYQPGPIAGGAEKLFGALMGGAGVQEAARQKEELRRLGIGTAEATYQDKVNQAFLSRDKRNAQQSYRADHIAAGTDPLLATVMANAQVGGSANLEQAQRYDFRAQIPAAFEADGMSRGNALVSALAPKLVPTVTNVDGQNVTDNYGATPVITDSNKTLSVIAANAARAGASQSQAGASDARAYRTLNPVWNPNTGGGTGVKTYAPPAFTDPSIQAQGEVFGLVYEGEGTDKERTVPDKIQAERFRIWRREKVEKGDTRFNNGAFAINEWANQHDINQIAVNELRKAERGTHWTERNKKSFFRAFDSKTAQLAQNRNPHGNAPSPIEPTALPEAARSKLREGVNTRFGNGQVWTITNGKPVQVN